MVRYAVWLDGKTVRNTAGGFRGGVLLVILGGLTLDLRNAGFSDAKINASIIFGRVDILITKNTIVRVRRPFVLGLQGLGRTEDPLQEAAITINVLGLFGDVNVREA
jgi:hypothetical protein